MHDGITLMVMAKDAADQTNYLSAAENYKKAALFFLARHDLENSDNCYLHTALCLIDEGRKSGDQDHYRNALDIIRRAEDLKATWSGNLAAKRRDEVLYELGVLKTLEECLQNNFLIEALDYFCSWHHEGHHDLIALKLLRALSQADPNQPNFLKRMKPLKSNVYKDKINWKGLATNKHDRIYNLSRMIDSQNDKDKLEFLCLALCPTTLLGQLLKHKQTNLFFSTLNPIVIQLEEHLIRKGAICELVSRPVRAMIQKLPLQDPAFRKELTPVVREFFDRISNFDLDFSNPGFSITDLDL